MSKVVKRNVQVVTENKILKPSIKTPKALKKIDTKMTPVDSKRQDIPIESFNVTNELRKMFNFRTTSSNNIRPDVMSYAIDNINKKTAIFELEKFVSIKSAIQIYEGVLEWTLIYINIETSDVLDFMGNIFNEKIQDICCNLDPNNTRIDNKTLRKSILNGYIDPYYIAFMTPQQIHPMRWSKELDKQRNLEEANNNKKVTDIYKCRKCGERKSTTSQMQLRSADEPMTIFVTCLVCYNTFTTQ